ncbi:glycosyltransferase family 4 protein [Allofournierella massiliensis]|uniref:glycosyltransferase family 4 protein n=1 Tax=Allofournierella massiliensis TaxID=1650663 RepID=UPI0039A139B3
MTVFWLLNFLPPPMARALDLPVQASGSWVMALQQALEEQPVRLILCAYSPAVSETRRREIGGVVYLALPAAGGKEALQAALAAEQPDLLQIFGTENDHAVWALESFAPQKTLLYIQGLAGPCGEHMTDGLPPRFLRRQRMKERLAARTGGATVRQLREGLLEKGEAEKKVFALARNVLGRTEWDKAFTASVNPQARYYKLNEILRAPFYSGGWQRDPLRRPRIFVSQGNTPLKGLHRVIEALPAIAARYPDVQVDVAGWPPPRKGALLQPVMNWLAEYPGYLDQLARRLGVADRIRYTGVLNAEAMKTCFLQSSVFLLPSSLENSPNSLGEAMLLGMPCAAANVGGVPSMMEDKKEGLLFDPARPDQMPQAVLALLDDPAGAEAMGKAARARAMADHDPKAIAAAQMALYNQLCGAKEAKP